jgi:hypothetical protein
LPFWEYPFVGLPRPLYTPFVCAIPNGKYKVRDWESCLRAA